MEYSLHCLTSLPDRSDKMLEMVRPTQTEILFEMTDRFMRCKASLKNEHTRQCPRDECSVAQTLLFLQDKSVISLQHFALIVRNIRPQLNYQTFDREVITVLRYSSFQMSSSSYW